MADQSELIAEFCSVTGATFHVAENYLAAHDFDLDAQVGPAACTVKTARPLLAWYAWYGGGTRGILEW